MKELQNLLVNSYSGDYTKIVSYIKKFLTENSSAQIILQKVDTKKHNVIAIFGEPKFLINCHMDTVPPSGSWKSDPHKLIIKNGKAFGLGTCDTKGNLYAILKAVKKTKPNNLMLLFSTDEESGSHISGVRYFLKSEYIKRINNAIVCEPTECQFVNRHKGYYSFIIDVVGKPSHSSLTKQPNAIVKSAEIITKLFKKEFNVGKIIGGTQGNVTAANCQFHISCRTYFCVERKIEEIKKIFKNDKSFTLRTKFVGVPFISKKKKFPFVNKEFYEAPYWTEAALFNEVGINSLVFGAGSVKQAHSQNEFVKLRELKKCEEFFINFIEKIK
ncbi:MAG: M20/M25/M40 family metallo-hydrolase [Ignavibacteriales bacterium]|nr:M20/M25/M40 family metallo-hydrolase [Ignavibacteriales bacterium]